MLKNLKNAFRNERFIDAHYVTFGFFILIFVPSTALTLKTGIGLSISSPLDFKYDNTKDIGILKLQYTSLVLTNVFIFIQNWVHLFLLYLIVK